MEMIYLVISFQGGTGMAVNFGGNVCPWEVQKTINLSFLACAIVWYNSSWCLFCRLIVLFCLLVLDPGGYWGDTERIVDQLQCPVASIEALGMVHQLMCLVPYRRIALATKMASE